MNNRLKKVGKYIAYGASTIMFLPIAGWLLLWVSGLEIAFNLTNSLPGNVYIVQPGVIPDRGEVISFSAPETARFYVGKKYLKRVAGVEGDLIEHKDGFVFLNGEKQAVILSKTLNGDTLVPGPIGPVPADSFFVLGKHERSYDSRYKSIGFIQKDRVIGRATVIF